MKVCCIFTSKKSNEPDLVFQQPKARFLPTTVLVIMTTEIHSVLPLSPQILAHVIPEQRFSFPIGRQISPRQPHTLSGLSRVPPGLQFCLPTDPAESLFKSVTLSRLLLSSFHLCCKREISGVASCHPASGCWTRKVFLASSRWFPILFCHFFI